jgi:(p)ppGpp synthase/HD superfamily hydrolase
VLGCEAPAFIADHTVTRAALAWAAEQHRGQRRAVDRAPFILHPLEVAALLSGGSYDDEVIAAGLLHDVIEDTSAGRAEVEARFGERVARIVAVLSEDPAIEGYRARKAALRAQVAAAGDRDAHAVYAADKVVKARELRSDAARAALAAERGHLRERMEHYEQSLLMLESAAPGLPLVRQLAFELWALRTLPPAPAAP